MNLPKILNKTILISPLDWGFGHTTRCVSLIQTLIESNNKVIFVGNTRQVSFIKTEFPNIDTEFLEGYNIELSSKRNTYVQILKQVFKIVRVVKKERLFVRNYTKEHVVDLILSDNRYGFRDSNIESIFIGHQLNLQLPNFKTLINKYLIKLINQFNKVWIVDEKEINLAGELSNSINLKIPFQYIGLLSRFKKHLLPIKYDFLIIVSGPHPENSIFLNEVEEVFKEIQLRIAIVSTVKSNVNLEHVDYFYNASTNKLNDLVNETETIISKSGYTTLMELSSLDKKAILIPTKGQFEQEYLAGHVKNKLFRFVKNSKQLKDLIS